jgi:hypothetical protein
MSAEASVEPVADTLDNQALRQRFIDDCRQAVAAELLTSRSLRTATSRVSEGVMDPTLIDDLRRIVEPATHGLADMSAPVFARSQRGFDRVIDCSVLFLVDAPVCVDVEAFNRLCGASDSARERCRRAG